MRGFRGFACRRPRTTGTPSFTADISQSFFAAASLSAVSPLVAFFAFSEGFPSSRHGLRQSALLLLRLLLQHAAAAAAFSLHEFSSLSSFRFRSRFFCEDAQSSSALFRHLRSAYSHGSFRLAEADIASPACFASVFAAFFAAFFFFFVYAAFYITLSARLRQRFGIASSSDICITYCIDWLSSPEMRPIDVMLHRMYFFDILRLSLFTLSVLHCIFRQIVY